MYFFCIPPHRRGVIGPVRERSIIQFDFEAVLLNKLLHLIAQAHRLTGTAVDDAVYFVLQDHSRDLTRQLINFDEVILILAGGKRELLLTGFFRCRQLGENRVVSCVVTIDVLGSQPLKIYVVLLCQ